MVFFERSRKTLRTYQIMALGSTERARDVSQT
jgi:hypothetical protein